MAELTPKQKEEIIRRRKCHSDKDGKVHLIANLEIHHKNRKPDDNRSANLRVLTKEEHRDLHKRAKR